MHNADQMPLLVPGLTKQASTSVFGEGRDKKHPESGLEQFSVSHPSHVIVIFGGIFDGIIPDV